MLELLPTHPSRWGPAAWDFLYCVAFSYPHKPSKQEKKDMHRFLRTLRHILPCKTCRDNYRKRVRQITDKNLSSKQSLVIWLMEVKNEIAKHTKGRLDTYHELCIKYQMNKLEV